MRIFLRVILFASIVWPALAMSLKSDEAAFRIVEYFVPNWVAGALLLRIVAAALFILSILAASNRINIGSKILAVIVLLPVFDNVLFLLGYEKFQTLFLFTNSVTEAILQTIFLCISFIGLISLPSGTLRKKWVYAIVVVCGIALSFIKPVYIDDWGSPLTTSPLSSSEIREFLHDHNLEISNDQPILLAYFTTSCPFCALTAEKMGISKRNEKLPQTVVVFPGIKEDAEEFLEVNALDNVPYLLVDKKTFLRYAGNSFPSLYYTSGQQAHHYTGSLFGFRALEYVAPQLNQFDIFLNFR